MLYISLRYDSTAFLGVKSMALSVHYEIETGERRLPCTYSYLEQREQRATAAQHSSPSPSSPELATPRSSSSSLAATFKSATLRLARAFQEAEVCQRRFGRIEPCLPTRLSGQRETGTANFSMRGSQLKRGVWHFEIEWFRRANEWEDRGGMSQLFAGPGACETPPNGWPACCGSLVSDPSVGLLVGTKYFALLSRQSFESVSAGPGSFSTLHIASSYHISADHLPTSGKIP